MHEPGSYPASARFDAALALARKLHDGQYRKGSTIPYIAHPLAVAGLALHYGADEEVAIAALLHDVVEDCGGSPMLDRVRVDFGARVAGIVEACTDSWESPKRPWEERKRDYVARLASRPPEVKLVVACDKLDNLRATVDDLARDGRRAFDKFSARPERLRWYYTECVRAVANDVPSRLANRLDDELTRVLEWIPA